MADDPHGTVSFSEFRTSFLSPLYGDRNVGKSRWPRMLVAGLSLFVATSADAEQPLSSNNSIPKSLQNVARFAKLKYVGSHHSGKKLGNFRMEPQKMNEWCWAAIASSVSKSHNQASEWSQCKIASKVLNRTCCDPDTNEAPDKNKLPDMYEKCDVTSHLQSALCVTDNYDASLTCDGEGRIRGRLTFDTVRREIEAKHPIGVRINRYIKDGLEDEKGGHFVVIFGYREHPKSYLVADPLRIDENGIWMSEENFLKEWTHSYFTRPAREPIEGVSLLPLPLPKFTVTEIKETDDVRLNQTGIRFGTANNRHIALIEDATLTDIGAADIATSESKELTLAMPHPVYVAGLSDFADSPDPLPKSSSGTRVLETVDSKLIAAYDFTGVGEADPQLVGGITSHLQLSALASGLQTATEVSKKNDGSPEVRLLKVPSLDFEALWLHYGDFREDVFIPTMSKTIPRDQIISKNDLTARLHELATKKP